jgi:hypothetical protein
MYRFFAAVVTSALIAGLVTVVTAPDALVTTSSVPLGKGDRLDRRPVDVCSPRYDGFRDNSACRRDRMEPERRAGELQIVSIGFERTVNPPKLGRARA